MMGDESYKEAAILCLSLVMFVVPDVKMDGEKKTGKRTGSKFEVRCAKVSHAAVNSRLLGRDKCLQALSQKVRLRLIAKSRGQFR
jgi:hypothetical protein